MVLDSHKTQHNTAHTSVLKCEQLKYISYQLVQNIIPPYTDGLGNEIDVADSIVSNGLYNNVMTRFSDFTANTTLVKNISATAVLIRNFLK